MLDYWIIKMELQLRELGLDPGNSQRILNAENGLSFCIQAGEENLSDCEQFFNHSYLSLPSEPTISVMEERLEEEEDLVSHEIVAETSENARILNEKLKYQINNSIKINDISNGRKINSNFGTFFNIKRRKDTRKRGRPPKTIQPQPWTKNKSNDVASIVLKNMAHTQKKGYAGMKMMIDSKTGQYIIRSSYQKSTNNESFAIEPWMLDKPRILQQHKEKLFLMTNRKSNSLQNLFAAPLCSNTVKNIPYIGTNNNELQYNDSQLKMKKSSIENKSLELKDESIRIIWDEGNIDKITNYISLSDKVKGHYRLSDDNDFKSDTFDLPELILGINAYESSVITKSRSAPGIKVFSKWEQVQERIEEIQEESMTKFIFEYRTPKFDADPQPFRRIQFELNTIRRDIEVVIPNNGIPFMFLGIRVFSCHLGKNRGKSKEALEESAKTVLRSKKIGCPAILSVCRIARFPDFDISRLSPDCESDVLQELKDAWDFSTDKVRYYIEYHLKEPKSSDHKGHEVSYLTCGTRFKEPLDPRVVEKIRDLTKQGISSSKEIREKVAQFICEDLFKGEQNPPLDRRRYNPCERDIRYIISKTKEEMKKEGKSIIQLQCSALATEISQTVKEITHVQYLAQLKSFLAALAKAVKAKDPLESVFLLTTPNTDGQYISSQSEASRRPQKRRKQEPTPTHDLSLHKEFIVDQIPENMIEQFYINVPEATDNVFSGQLYAPEFVDINEGLVDTLQAAPEDNTVTEVYYYYPDGTCELAAPMALANGQT